MVNQNGFTLKHTNIVKGIAVLLLLWHHLFYNNPATYDHYISLFYFAEMPIEAFLADYCKVCVAIFVFLSGYGLFKKHSSYQTIEQIQPIGIKEELVFLKNRLLKLMNPFWFVYLLFVPMSLFLGDKPFFEVYGTNPLHYITDFFGLSYLFYGHEFTMNATWWYMSEIIILMLLFPIIIRLYKKIPELIVLISIALCIIVPDTALKGLNVWLCPFILGIYFADKCVFERLSVLFNTVWKQLLVIVFSLILFAYLRTITNMSATKLDFLFMLPIILSGYFIISKIPFLSKVFEELGEKSGLIFLFHTFIFSKYFADFTYSFKYSILIYFVFLIICIVVAFALDYLMQITRYKKAFQYLTAIKTEL